MDFKFLLKAYRVGNNDDIILEGLIETNHVESWIILIMIIFVMVLSSQDSKQVSCSVHFTADESWT